MDLAKALFEMKRQAFPYQSGSVFLSLPPSIQDEVLRHEGLDQAFFIAFKPIFKNLTTRHKMLLAGHKSCDRSLLILLSSENQSIREQLAANPSSPKEVLMILANESVPEIREALLKNPASDREVLEIVNSNRGFVEITQGNESLSEMSINELKANEENLGSQRIRFLSDYRKPSYGTSLYRVEGNGRLKLVATNFDSSD